MNDFQEVKFFENRANGQSKGFCAISMGSESSMRLCMDRLPKKTLHGQVPVVTLPTKQALNQFESQQKTRPNPPPPNAPRGPPQNMGPGGPGGPGMNMNHMGGGGGGGGGMPGQCGPQRMMNPNGGGGQPQQMMRGPPHMQGPGGPNNMMQGPGPGGPRPVSSVSWGLLIEASFLLLIHLSSCISFYCRMICLYFAIASVDLLN